MRAPFLEDRADAQEERQSPGLEDAALGVPQRPALTLEQEPLLDEFVAEDQISTLESADVVEGGLANHRVASDEVVSRHLGPGSGQSASAWFSRAASRTPALTSCSRTVGAWVSM